MKILCLINIVIAIICSSEGIHSQTIHASVKAPSYNIANILIEHNNSSDIRKILDYYGWNMAVDSLIWRKDQIEELLIVTANNGKEIERVELKISKIRNLSERFKILQYVLANERQKESVPGQNTNPEEMFVSRRKRIGVYSQGNQTLLVFFRSTKQGYTRFGPEQKMETRL